MHLRVLAISPLHADLTGMPPARGTRVFEQHNGQWQMVHQHLSIPVTGE